MTQETPLYLREFPDFDNAERFEAALKALAPLGFVDASWHNDTCPSLRNEDADAVLFIDYADKEKRELKDNSMFCYVLCDLPSLESNDLDRLLTVLKWDAVNG